ncbi:hypothetical protein V8F20_009344 [Naviculisporaceae sp. PSN 640]
MNGVKNGAQGAMSRKRSASAQSPDGRPTAKKTGMMASNEEEVPDLDIIANEVKATVRTIHAETEPVKQFFWQATALPKNLPKMLASIEKNVKATLAPSRNHRIYLKHSVAGSADFIGSTRTSFNNNRFKNEMDKIIEKTKLSHPEERIAVVVLIYQPDAYYPNNQAQRALMNGLRDDLHVRLGGMEDACDLKEQLKECQEAVQTWMDRTKNAEDKIQELRATIRDRDFTIAVLDGGIPRPDIGNPQEKIEDRGQQHDRVSHQLNQVIQQSKEALQQRDEAVQRRDEAIQQRDEAIQQRDEAVQQRDEAIQQRDEADKQRENLREKRDKYVEELLDEIAKANSKVDQLEREGPTPITRREGSEEKYAVGGLQERLERSEEQLSNLQTTIDGLNEVIRNRDQEIASAKAREEGLRGKMKGLVEEKYAREKKEMEQEMERKIQEMERQRLKDLEDFGPL